MQSFKFPMRQLPRLVLVVLSHADLCLCKYATLTFALMPLCHYATLTLTLGLTCHADHYARESMSCFLGVILPNVAVLPLTKTFDNLQYADRLQQQDQIRGDGILSCRSNAQLPKQDALTEAKVRGFPLPVLASEMPCLRLLLGVPITLDPET